MEQIELVSPDLALSLPAALLFRLYSTLNQSLGNPRFVTWVQAVGLLVKIPLSIWPQRAPRAGCELLPICTVPYTAFNSKTPSPVKRAAAKAAGATIRLESRMSKSRRIGEVSLS